MSTSLVTDTHLAAREKTVTHPALDEGVVASTPGWQVGRVFSERQPAVRIQGCC